MRPPSFPARSLHLKLLWGTTLVICVVMGAVLLVVEHRQRAAVIDEAHRRGEIPARDLAAVSQAPLLLYNFPALEQNVAPFAAGADAHSRTIRAAEGRAAARAARS